MTQQAGETKPKKKMSGCVIALIAAGTVMLIGIIGVAALIIRVLDTPEGKKIVHFVGATASMMSEAQNAKGAAEIRGMGCVQAMVIDSDKMQALMADLTDGGDGKDDMDEPRSDKIVIACVVSILAKPVACDAVASTYVNAAQPTVPFSVSVSVQGDNKPKCLGRYMPDGTRRATEPVDPTTDPTTE